ncbi:DNA polymerase/3'-5' exonuclease PolX [Pedobacter sp. SYSU D00535]|uniref:DNA polymerase/3'-5' exonuclease PolX n=1 Tax=Pedobacter sp. SYSU D00535 TaxID=2810308 RepID=UPI001A959DBA|nr:DNA polymerase/3'-5' exonuclease PolX [Pedobacter sp. SYSU D00535]
MDNKAVSKKLNLLSQLIELHEINQFKAKSLAAAAYKIGKLPYPIAKKQIKEIEQIDSIGKSTAAKIAELLETGTMQELEELMAETPEGVVEILGIKGVGPKKVNVIWKDLGINSVGELFYACNENRLIEAKGFGLKTQEEIKKAIEFKIASNGRFLYAQVQEVAQSVYEELTQALPETSVSFTGDFRRKCEIIDGLDLLVVGRLSEAISKLKAISSINITSQDDDCIQAEHTTGIKIIINFCEKEELGFHLARLTASEKHWTQLLERLPSPYLPVATEEEIYKAASLPYIEPELREGLNEFELAASGKLPELIEWRDLKGTLHCHSTWSDGMHSLEEMAIYCRDQLKLEYMGISDHSQSAFYAKGLKAEQILAQHEEIDRLNAKLDNFRIFKGIESDILFDGSLDYPDEILATFDFVIASIHSMFKMTEEKATNRLISAIENPHTTILGHPTGRMLLTRNGYPVDFRKVIDACAANQVVIEINSNPLRLDLDWRWHQYAQEKGVMLSINPDAHSLPGFLDTRYGVNVARKGGLTAANCLNALNVTDIEARFKQKKGGN